jgi:hypothetical protein
LRFLLSEDGGKSPFARKTRGRGAAKEGKKEGTVYPSFVFLPTSAIMCKISVNQPYPRTVLLPPSAI